ncbi:MAG: glycosyltransferase [Candidatus Wallbacteria bacterium]|nr:glycosyltransferase [Candidatus Wallbacteria bacterium]
MTRRLAHVITGLGMGGAEAMLYRLIAQTDRSRFEPHVVSLMDEGTYGPRLRQLGVAVHTVGLEQGRPTPRGAYRLARLLRGLDPDGLQGWMYHGNFAATLASWLLPRRVPVLWNVRSSLYTLANEKPGTALVIRAGAALSKSTAAIVYCSRVSASQHEAHGFAPGRSVLIPNGFDCEQLRPDPVGRESMRVALGACPDTVLIGHVARWHPMKDHANFARAAGLAARQVPALRFVAVGTGVGETNAEWMTEVRRAGIVDRLHMLGERDDVPKILAGLDLFCSSSWSEAYPNVVGEAMATGLPCAVTDAGDSAWIVGETGRVVPPRDPEALAGALVELARLTADQRRNLGDLARDRVLREFSLPRASESYHALWEAALA